MEGGEGGGDLGSMRLLGSAGGGNVRRGWGRLGEMEKARQLQHSRRSYERINSM